MMTDLADAASRKPKAAAAAPAAPTLDHPLLAAWSGPYGGVPAFDKVKVEDFVPAIDVAIAAAKSDIDAIVNAKSAPTFENTLVAMERAGRPLNRVNAVFGVYDSTMSVGPMQEVAGAVYQKLAAYSDWVAQNEALFRRVEAVYKGPEFKTLSLSQQRLTSEAYKDFVRNGVGLDAAGKKRLSEINQRLATLFTTFGQNVLADEQTFTLVENKDQLKGLPDSIVAGMASTAEAKGKKGQWAVANTRSAVEPFLTYADDRAMREKVWRAFVNRGDNGDSHDNNKIIAEVLRLRAERAKLLGYETHAHWRLENQMAKTPDAAMALMMKVWPKAVARVKEEVAAQQKIADKSGAKITIEPWDYRYYQEKVRKAKYDLDMNAITPYMQLDKLKDGMMWAAEQLYHLRFEKIADVPVYQPDVTVYKVTDARDGRLRGLWYFDPYAREGKSSGAWMNEYRSQEKFDGAVVPIVSNNSNFIKAEAGKPVLISWDDATTMFHEFGHALHGLLSNVDYPSQAGTNTARDFVEFPSQINEHWLSTPEILNKFAVHYETGEPLPKALFDKIEKAKKFNEGFKTVEYLSAAIVDMKFHLASANAIDADKFERDALAEIGMPKEIVMRHRSPQFQHIFSSDGYSAGYYSYLWSDALTADAAELFAKRGFYDKQTAAEFEKCILSAGDTMDQADEFRCFMGRDVDTRALLRKRGFPVK
ncbi:MAG: M3 family metallopeptidase [Parvularculaceae bacterium]|nr:M3 family metallopeptidase [Parvularculaceae bacterium]